MNKMLMLDRIKAHYDEGGNIIQHLRALDNKAADDPNSKYDVLISYDFQAGTYSRSYNHEHKLKYTRRLSEIINGLKCKKDSILEAGVGEATTLVGLLNHEGMTFKNVYGNDISWSRIKFAQKFFRSKMSTFPRVDNDSQHGGGWKSQLFVGDIFSLPLLNNSIDIVFTSHSLEPNGGHEKELLEELYRVTNNYLLLLEPAYEFADETSRARMKKHGYVTNLYETARQLGYKVLMHELYGVSDNPLNPTGLILIEKGAAQSVEQPFCDPLTHTPMTIKGNVYFSEDSLISYPIVNDVPCLMKEYAIVTTKMNEFY